MRTRTFTCFIRVHFHVHQRCWVVEDSEIGCKAGKAAGMKVVITKSIYTENENFEGADAVIRDLDNG